jgi:hypothetical protein
LAGRQPEGLDIDHRLDGGPGPIRPVVVQLSGRHELPPTV